MMLVIGDFNWVIHEPFLWCDLVIIASFLFFRAITVAVETVTLCGPPNVMFAGL